MFWRGTDRRTDGYRVIVWVYCVAVDGYAGVVSADGRGASLMRMRVRNADGGPVSRVARMLALGWMYARE